MTIINSLDIAGLSKTFKGKRGSRIEALKSLTFQVAPGEVFGFLGPNGAGKSTTIKCLMGLIKPTCGVASILGEAAGSVASRAKIGYLPENPSLYDYLSAEEYLHFVGQAYNMPEGLLARRSEETLKQLELWDARKRQMRFYSKGMVQRVGLAQTLLHDPDLYILDEPMSGLDPIGRAQVKDIMLELKSRGKCIFFSTHITADVESVCDRVGIILKGELKSVEQVDKIMTEGVVGYNLRIRKRNQSELVQRYVSREELPVVMHELSTAGDEISLIEPSRKSLEDFFLDIVRGKSS